MLCQKCHKRTATVFISSIINNRETMMYLCTDCAKEYPLFNFNFKEPFSIKDIMDKLEIDNNEEQKHSLPIDRNKEISEKNIVCPNCTTTYSDYKKTGKLGCDECYEVFKEELNSVFNNMYDKQCYVGKIPDKQEDCIYISNEIRVLKQDLNIAVKKEEYEVAANIRDKIKELQKCDSSGGSIYEK